MIEFNIVWASNKLNMISYFRKSFKLYIKVKIKQQNWVSVSFKNIFEKAVNIEKKTYLNCNAIVWNSDAYSFRSYFFSYIIFSKIQIQRFRTKKSNPKEFKPKKFKLTNQKPLSYPILISLILKKLFVKIRRKNILKRNKSKKTLL